MPHCSIGITTSVITSAIISVIATVYNELSYYNFTSMMIVANNHNHKNNQHQSAQPGTENGYQLLLFQYTIPLQSCVARPLFLHLNNKKWSAYVRLIPLLHQGPQCQEGFKAANHIVSHGQTLFSRRGVRSIACSISTPFCVGRLYCK